MAITPGPWVLGVRTAHYAPVGYPLPPFEAASIGTSNGHDGKQIAFVPLDESNMENARLISAAPDLLAALEAIAPTMDYYDPVAEPLRSGWAQCKAAMAKAKGET